MWPLSLLLLVFGSFVGFAIGLVIGADFTRARLLRQLREQIREDGTETLRRVY